MGSVPLVCDVAFADDDIALDGAFALVVTCPSEALIESS